MDEEKAETFFKSIESGLEPHRPKIELADALVSAAISLKRLSDKVDKIEIILSKIALRM